VAPLRQTDHARFRIVDEADAGALRRTVAGYATSLGAAPARAGRAELVATELATNVLLHAKPGGWVLARPILPSAIEIIAVDRGPGIADPASALAGHTTVRGGLGRGLAAVRRACAHFDMYTEPGRGTTVLAVVSLDDSPPAARSWAGVSIGLTDACGDGWGVAEFDDGLAVVVVDGLGHGPKASVAADAALAAFAEGPADLDGFIDRANVAMRATRGGVVAGCRLDHDTLEHVAVGNINARVWNGSQSKGLPFRDGALGIHTAPPRAGRTSHPWSPGAVLVVWTDGLSSRIDLSAYTDLAAHDPAVIAATLHRDHSRERDDATVVVVRNTEAP
jgi:anti-sigma regulatory factor (Ser/Thr protein kinase)